MAFSFGFYLFLGFMGSFIGTIPFGPINLSVVDTTLKRGMRAAIIFSLAAAVIEFVYSYISLSCYWILNEKVSESTIIPATVAVIFIAAGILFFLKKERKVAPGAEHKKKGNFIKGLIISALNPQAIPYWIFIIGFYQVQQYIDMSSTKNGLLVLGFVLGAAIGKILCLWLFALLSKSIAHRLVKISAFMNKIIGAILIFIGLSQVIRIL